MTDLDIARITLDRINSAPYDKVRQLHIIIEAVAAGRREGERNIFTNGLDAADRHEDQLREKP